MTSHNIGTIELYLRRLIFVYTLISLAIIQYIESWVQYIYPLLDGIGLTNTKSYYFPINMKLS